MTVRELIATCNNRILSYELNITSIVAVKPIRQCATHNIAIGMNDLFEQYGDREVKTFCINKTKNAYRNIRCSQRTKIMKNI